MLHWLVHHIWVVRQNLSIYQFCHTSCLIDLPNVQIVAKITILQHLCLDLVQWMAFFFFFDRYTDILCLKLLLCTLPFCCFFQHLLTFFFFCFITKRKIFTFYFLVLDDWIDGVKVKLKSLTFSWKAVRGEDNNNTNCTLLLLLQ